MKQTNNIGIQTTQADKIILAALLSRLKNMIFKNNV